MNLTTIHLPTLNACLNATAGVLLFCGYKAIKNKNLKLHRTFMLSALVCSTLFLCSYLIYHATSGSTPYEGEGFLRILYFSILLTHIPLAVIIVPFCLVAVYHAIKGNISKHTKITVWLWPTWMYVSVTGVIIYLMLYIF